MERIVVIRKYKPGDDVQCKKIVYDATMSTVGPSFVAALIREVAIQLLVFFFAALFVFVGLSPMASLLAIPSTAGVLFATIYIAHWIKATFLMRDMDDIQLHYMSDSVTGFWVAELYQSRGTQINTNVPIKIINETAFDLYEERYQRRIIGTVAIVRSSKESSAAWLRRMAVVPEFQRVGIGSALVEEVKSFCRRTGYASIVLVTTECHSSACALYHRMGFDLRQLYHKQLLGNIIQILMYEYCYTITDVSHIA